MLNKISTEDLKKELHRRSGIAYLEMQIEWINKIEMCVEDLRRVKEEALSKIENIRRGDSFEGKYPVMPKLDTLTQELNDLVYCRT